MRSAELDRCVGEFEPDTLFVADFAPEVIARVADTADDAHLEFGSVEEPRGCVVIELRGCIDVETEWRTVGSCDEGEMRRRWQDQVTIEVFFLAKSGFR
jgi:hypothetical protein